VRHIKHEVAQCMNRLVELDGSISAGFVFPEDFIGFQGHFPSGKLLPGVCQIQCVTVMIEKMAGKKLVIEEIILAKFFSPVFPSEELTCVCKASGAIGNNGDGLVVKASVTKGAVKVAEIKLRVRFIGGRE
jgi:3-hydroxyacyl-[acyl-carrier-protein] dehydratase